MTFANVLLPPRSCAPRTKPRPGIEGRSTARGRASGTGARGVRLFPRAPGPAARSFRCALRWLKASECPKAQGIPEPNGSATCPGADALCRKEQEGDKDFDSAVPGRHAKFARSPRVCGDRLTRSRRLFDHPPHTHTHTRSFHHRKRRTQSSLHELTHCHSGDAFFCRLALFRMDSIRAVLGSQRPEQTVQRRWARAPAHVPGTASPSPSPRGRRLRWGSLVEACIPCVWTGA